VSPSGDAALRGATVTGCRTTVVVGSAERAPDVADTMGAAVGLHYRHPIIGAQAGLIHRIAVMIATNPVSSIWLRLAEWNDMYMGECAAARTNCATVSPDCAGLHTGSVDVAGPAAITLVSSLVCDMVTGVPEHAHLHRGFWTLHAGRGWAMRRPMARWLPSERGLPDHGG
jgi:hypothetical protein